MRSWILWLTLWLAAFGTVEAFRQAPTGPAQGFRSIYVVVLQAKQPSGSVDVPVPAGKPLQLLGMSARPINSATGTVLDGIDTVLEGNGIVVRPVDGNKPDVDLRPGSTIRLTSFRTKTSAIPARVEITLTTTARE